MVLWGVVLLLGLGVWLRHKDADLGSTLEAKASIFGGGPIAVLQSGFDQAQQAATLAQTANSVEQWDGVVEAWTGAIATLQTIPDRKSTRLNSSHPSRSRMPSSA